MPNSLKLGRQWVTYSKAPKILLTAVGVVGVFILQKTSCFSLGTYNQGLGGSPSTTIMGVPFSLKLGRQWETYSKAPNILLTVAGVVGIFIL